MQKVVGSNPISRSISRTERTMTESNRKQTQAQRKRRRSLRRDSGSRAQKPDEAAAKQAQAEKSQTSAKPRQDAGNVSSLLETSSKEVKQLLEAADDAAEKIREAAQTDTATRDEPVASSDAVSLISRTNSEVQRVLEAAEDAAEKIREEARLEARQLIDDTRRQAESVTSDQMQRVSDLTAGVLGELNSVQSQLDNLRAAFDRAIQKMGADVGVERTDVWDARNGAPEEDDEGQESAELRRRLGRRRKTVPQGTPEGISEGARLLALQQLIAGVDADVIEERLKNEFGIKNPGPILEWMGLQSAKSEKSKKS